MSIVRKIRSSYNDDSVAMNTLPRNKAPSLSKYILPTEDTVPADRYYSEIVHMERTRTRSTGKDALAVYYNIAKFSDVYNKSNKLFKNGEKLKVLHIKQIYPIDSDAYSCFIDAMYQELGLDEDEELTIELCIALTEAISIGYTSRSGIGGITARCYWDNEAFIERYQKQQQAYASAYEDYDEYGNPI